jgi:hypothetical protein
MADTDDSDEELVIDLSEDDVDLERGAAAKEKEKSPPQQQASVQAKPPPVPGPSSRPAPQTGLKDLEAQIASERAAKTRVAEENRRLQLERDQAIAFAQEAERRGMSTYELYNENQIKSAEEQLDALTMQQEAAMNEGDFKSAADLNRRMQRLGGQLALLERDRGTLAQQRENMKAQHSRRPQQQPQRQAPAEPPTDPLERAIAGRTEPTKQFLRKHPELIRGDGSLKRSAIDAHERALDDGHTVDTPGYFDYIEKLIGSGREAAMPSNMANGGAQGAPVRQEVRQRAPTMAAPVERGAAPGGGGNTDPNTFVMTPKMRRLAEEQGVTPRDWAVNYIRLLKEGRINPIT